MKLTVNKQLIQMPVNAAISIERTSPMLNENTGTFSYPFPVPTLPNEKALGYPGRLQRVGYLSTKSFVLEDEGLQVVRGEIDFDNITSEETGIILKSGLTEFYARVKGRNLSQVNFGDFDIWGWATNRTEMLSVLAGWDAENTLNVSHHVFAPVKMIGAASEESANVHDIATDKLYLPPQESGVLYENTGWFMVQLRVWWILKTIFESHGYTVEQNDLQTSDFKKLILFTNPFYSVHTGPDENLAIIYGVADKIDYESLMPEDVSVIDFLDAVKNLTCTMIDIDERRKVVRIVFKKDIFLPANLDNKQLRELNTWEHSEDRQRDGFALRYQSQTNELDTEEDYYINQTVQTTLPTPTYEDEVVHITDYDRDYVAIRNDADALEWKRIGRLKGYVVAGGEEEATIPVNIPEQVAIDGAEGAQLQSDLTGSWAFPPTPIKINGLYFSLYHGRHDFNGFNCPYTCPENYSMATDGLPYVPKNTTPSLVPAQLHELVYADFLSWLPTKRLMIKYLRLSLRDVINLQWNKRYVVNGIPILLNKINFELPHRGLCKIEAYTAPAREEEINFGPLPPNLIM